MSSAAEVLDLAEKSLADKQLQATAGLATLRIANRIKNRDAQRASKALDNVIKIVEH